MTDLRPGMRVELTDKARKVGLRTRRRNKTGLATVTVVSKIAPYVEVREDGYVKSEPWHADFWQEVTA